MIQGEFKALGLIAVQVLLGDGDGIEIRKVDFTRGSRADHLTTEPVESTAELALPDFPVHTEVLHPDLGPGEDGVGHGIVGITGRGLSIGEHPGSAPGITVDVGVSSALRGAGETVGPAELEVVHGREDVLEEPLLGDSPTDGVGREQAPTLTLLVHVAAVVTAHHLHEILAHVVVVDTADVTGGAVGGTGALVAAAGIEQTLVDHVVRIEELLLVRAIVAGGANHRICDAGEFAAEHRGHVVAAELTVEQGLNAAVDAGVVVPHLGILGLVTGVGPGVGRRIGHIIVEDEALHQGALLAAAEVVGAGGLELETFQERSLIGEVDGVAEVLAVGLGEAGRLGIQQGNRVEVLFHVRVVGRIVLGMNAHSRIGLIDIVEDVPVQVEVAHTLVGALAEVRGITHREFREELHGDVAIEAVALVAVGVALQDGVIVCVAAAEVIVHQVVAAHDGNVVLLVESSFPVHFIIPVGVDGVVDLALGVCPGLGTALIGSDLRIGPAVIHLAHVGHRVLPLHERSPAFHLAGHDRLGETQVGAEVHARLLDLALLRGDEDHAVLRAQTVDSRGSVLQDGDALDILGVQFLQDGEVGVAFQRVGILVPGGGLTGTGGGTDDTVHDHHRGTEATEVDFGGEGARLAAVLGNQQARDLALEGGDAVGRLGGGDVLGADLGDGARQGFTLLDAVTDDHGLIQQLGVFPQDHLHLRLCLEHARFETDGGNLDGSVGRDREGEITVNVGSRTIGGALLEHGRADDGLLHRIRDRSGHRDVLSQQRRSAENKSQHHGHHSLERIRLSHIG